VRKLFRDNFPPLLRAIDPFIRNLNPLLTGLGLYKHEVTGFFGNVAAASNLFLTEEFANGEHPFVLRAMGHLNPETLSSNSTRLTSNRNSAYSPPQWAKNLVAGLPSFSIASCTSGSVAALNPETAKSSAFQGYVSQAKEEGGGPRTPEEILKESEDFFARLKRIAFAEQMTTAVPAPPCRLQSPVESIYGSGEATTYQHTFEQTGK